MGRQKLKWLELRRQLFHLILGLVLIVAFIFGTPFWAYGILLAIVFIILLLARKHVQPWKTIVDRFDRKDQFFTGWGALTFVNGFFITTMIFPPILAAAALSIMVFGDGFSTLIGKYFGTHRLLKNKTWEGTLAGLAAAFLAAWFFVPWYIALVGAVVGMIVEIAIKPHPVYDDNLFMPLTSGIAMFAAVLLIIFL